MRTRDLVTDDKLRGGFYTPQPLVMRCLDRVRELVDGREGLQVLEPSVGDGAFIRGMGNHTVAQSIGAITGIELVAREAEHARNALLDHGFAGSIAADSFLQWASDRQQEFDIAIGNPPFLRFQFVDDADRIAATTQLTAAVGSSQTGVANLWIPLFLRALTLLREKGVFAFVVPAEILTGMSASLVRRWMGEHVEKLQIDLFEPGSFPGVLQEVVVVSGVIGRVGRPALAMVEHRGATELAWSHGVEADSTNWTRYLLRPAQLEAYDHLRITPCVRTLGSIAKFDVSIVTGANDFFTVNRATARRYGLEEWTRPMLPRARHAPGLRFTGEEHRSLALTDARAYLLDFSSEAHDPMAHAAARKYLAVGEARGIPERYKCRIRTPWYRVPNVRHGALLLAKRSHEFPRMVVNSAAAFTTDTIYRGTLRVSADSCSPEALAAGFHNSVTLLGAELEGRSFGGGVLELVPSEIGRLPVVADGRLAADFTALDATARRQPESLIQATDGVLLRRRVFEDADALSIVALARRELMSRRLDRARVGNRVMAIPISADVSPVALAEVS